MFRVNDAIYTSEICCFYALVWPERVNTNVNLLLFQIKVDFVLQTVFSTLLLIYLYACVPSVSNKTITFIFCRNNASVK